MPASEQGVEAVDHRKEALRMMDEAASVQIPGTRPGPDQCLAASQVHASLAIAEQLERLNETLESRAFREALHEVTMAAGRIE